MLKAKNRIGLVFFPAFDWAISPTHPEREERLLYTQDQVLEEGLLDIEGITEYKPDIASIRDVERVHVCVPDVKSRITDSHLISAGGAIACGEALMKGEVDKAFAVVRPPGHHARRIVHGARGFCNINIEAVMIEKLRKNYGVRKVAIVDTDCHHGDGTQDIYWHDSDTLFISIHQDGRTLYPGTGFPSELGGPNAVGYTLNVPLPPRTSDKGFIYVIDNLINPVLKEFEPDLVINSAGQDNHYSDPITNMNFSAQGYAELNHRLNPHIAVLEGGYSIEDALPYVNTGIILAMAGLDYSMVKEPDFLPEKFKQSLETDEYIKGLCEHLYNKWEQRDIIRNELVKNKRYIKQTRHVYYDTDGISEMQEEVTRICHECSGLSVIDSRSDRGYHITAVIIPRDACSQCCNEGYEIYENKLKSKGCMVFLQDKKNECFLKKGTE